MKPSEARRRYSDSGSQIVSQERLIVLLYERALRDLAEARSAVDNNDVEGRHQSLVHAQQIVEELAFALRPADWEGADSLKAVYDYVLSLLVNANIRQDAQAIEEAEHILGNLGEAWRLAYISLQPTQAAG